jgi:hypothetical protein
MREIAAETEADWSSWSSPKIGRRAVFRLAVIPTQAGLKLRSKMSSTEKGEALRRELDQRSSRCLRPLRKLVKRLCG